MTTASDAQKVLEQADCLFTRDEVDAAIDRIAQAINRDYAGLNPVVLCVMNGGVVLAGHLLTRLSAVLEFDYMHATRYRGETTGGELLWKHHHEIALNGRDVLVVDDILDYGETLKAIREACLKEGAASFRSAALVKKIHDNNCGIEAEYVGLEVPDRYVFGYGMDYKDFLRNAPGIYAVRDS
ncbi:MAG: hypoxanthine-guanine phosphoribosyltransferase [Gammaproteobacteria bacterium]|jgi:hypoxanthine phosphoribosyltransferase